MQINAGEVHADYRNAMSSQVSIFYIRSKSTGWFSTTGKIWLGNWLLSITHLLTQKNVKFSPGKGHRVTYNRRYALAGVAQWIEGRPVNQRVAGSTLSQGTCLGCRSGSCGGGGA